MQGAFCTSYVRLFLTLKQSFIPLLVEILMVTGEKRTRGIRDRELGKVP